MQIATLKVFCDLAETASFSRAADLNAVTQSAVSQQIRTLETKFDTVLIERGRKNFALTQQGRIFLNASKKMLQIFDNLGHQLHEVQDVVAGDLRVVTVFSVGLHELPPYLKSFRAAYPDVRLQVDYRRNAQVYNEVLNGEADLGLVAFPQRKPGLAIEQVWKDQLVVICPPEHDFSSRKRVHPKELDGERFIMFEPDLPTRKAVDGVLRKYKAQVSVINEFDTIETVKRAVEIDAGISIVPRNAVLDEVRSGTLSALELECEAVWRPLGLIWKRDKPISPAVKQFTIHLKEKVDATKFRKGFELLNSDESKKAGRK